MKNHRLPVGLFALSVAACTPKLIPGTNIHDTDDTRAILDVMDRYRRAVESRDINQLMPLLADSFHDDMGTSTPDDDLDYARLRAEQPQRFARLSDVRVDMTVRKVEIDDEQQVARAVYTYTTSFKMPGLSDRPVTDSEIKEMRFKRVGDQWKITSGI